MKLKTMFTKIRSHFSTPGAKLAYDASARVCRYRTPAGRKCAVGVLIDDYHYDESFEGNDADTLLRDGLSYLIARQTPEEKEKALHFLVEAQGWHDARATGTHYPAIFEKGEAVRFGAPTVVEKGVEFFLQDLEKLALKYEIPTK